MNRIGFHVRSIDELARVTSIEGVDLVELKPDKLKKAGSHLYYFNCGAFAINPVAARQIQRLCEGIHIQIHLPFERKLDPACEDGLCQAIAGHHPMLLERYRMAGQLLQHYGIGAVLTTHPPAFAFDGKKIATVEEALRAGKELYQKLDEMMKLEGYTYDVGIENTVMPKNVKAANVGYTPEMIDALIGSTSRIGITVDSGHRRLNDEMSVAKLFSYGRIVNVHLHSNSGHPSQQSYDDDEHVLATPRNLEHFNRYIKSFRRFGMPIVLEVEKMEEHSNEELADYVKALRERIGRV